MDKARPIGGPARRRRSHGPLRVAAAILAVLLAAGCGGTAWEPLVLADGDGIRVASRLPVDRVEVEEVPGLPVIRRTLPAALPEFRVDVPLRPGLQHRVVLRSGSRVRGIPIRTPPDPGPLDVLVEAPLGQELRQVGEGQVVSFGTIEGISSKVAVRLQARAPVSVDLDLCGQRGSLDLRVEGQRAQVVAPAPLASDCAVRLVVQGGEETAFVLRPEPVSIEDARRALRIDQVLFPADEAGRPDAGRAPDRVSLPSPFWESIVRRTRLGARPAAAESPWAWVAIAVRNDGAVPVNAVVRLAVLDGGGQPARAFRPRLRSSDGDTGLVTGLLRVPAEDTAIARLPLFVDPSLLVDRASAWTRRIELTPLGSDSPLLTSERPLWVRRGSTASSAGIAAALLGMSLGIALLALRLRRWLHGSSTSDLVTIALFAGLMFFFSAASHLLGLGVATILGPFSSLLTGLVDDAFRCALLATLVTLLPRPGVVAMAVLVHYLMRALALGGFQPSDPIILFSAVIWLEAGLWASGATRSDGWQDERALRRFARLALAFCPASVAGMAVGLVVSAVLYRLYFAAWYVAMLLLLPGFLYTVLACALATGFAASLRRVEG